MRTASDKKKPSGATQHLPSNNPNIDPIYASDNTEASVTLKLAGDGKDNSTHQAPVGLSSLTSPSPSPTASVDILNTTEANNRDQVYQCSRMTSNAGYDQSAVKRVQFDELVVAEGQRQQQQTVISQGESDTISRRISGQELINFSNLQTLNSTDQHDTAFNDNLDNLTDKQALQSGGTSTSELDSTRHSKNSNSCNISNIEEEDNLGDNFGIDDDDDDDDDDEWYSQAILSDLTQANGGQGGISNDHCRNSSVGSPSRYKSRSKGRQQQATYVSQTVTKLKFLTTGLTNKILGTPSYTSCNENDNQDLLTGATKYPNNRVDKRIKRSLNNSGRTFRGSYRYSRIGIVMAVFKKLTSFLIQRSTLALFGAFLIHVTLGTVYTLSNINSYLTSYMRKHGTPNATYGGSMWISSSYAVGQGLSMVLGGYLERRFSARFSCFLGCALHSISIMSTSKAIDHGHLAVLLTYGFLPGFGCGLSYMTPMSNGFGWFPNRKGLVAGVILAGFGIGTFVFNMAQTAFVNPENLSPPADSGGYFNQESILNRVPQLFIFMGSVYASMQFIGCCLLFKPPNGYESMGKSSDTKPILAESEPMTLHKAVRTREFIVLFLVFGITNQGVLFVNSMLKEYGQIFINNDLFLAWTGSMASIANSLGRLTWGLAIDKFTFTQCFTSITTIFGLLMFLMPFEFVLSSKLLYLLCTLGIFGSFSGWMSTYPVHISRVFGVQNSGVVYGLIFVSQSIGGIFTAFAAHYLIDNYSRFVPFFCVTLLELLGLAIYHLFYNK